MLPSFSDILLDDDVLGNECLVEDEELGEVLLVNDDGLLYNKDQLEGGQWVTIGGAHVYIKGGKIAAGPAAFKGKTIKQATAHATKVKKDVASTARKVEKTSSKVEKAKAALEKAKAELKKHSEGLATVRKQIKQTKVKSTAAQSAVSKAQKGKVDAPTDIHEHIRKTNELARKSVAGTLRSEDLESHMKALNKLNKDQVLRLAEATNISASKTKKAALEAIHKYIHSQGIMYRRGLEGSGEEHTGVHTVTAKENSGKLIGKALDDAMGRIKAGGDHKAETAEVHRQVDDAFKGVRLKAHAEAIARGFGILPKGTIAQTKDAIKAHVTARVGSFLRTRLSDRPDTADKSVLSKHADVARTVLDTLKNHEKATNLTLTLDKVHAAVATAHPHVTKDQIKDVLIALHKDRQIILERFGGAHHTIPTAIKDAAITGKELGRQSDTPGRTDYYTTIRTPTTSATTGKSTGGRTATTSKGTSVAQSIVDTVNGGASNLKETYNTVKRQHPSLTLGEFHDHVKSLHDSGHIQGQTYNESLATLPSHDHALYHHTAGGSRVIYDVVPGHNAGTPVTSAVEHKTLPKGLSEKLGTFVADARARDSFDSPSIARAHDHLKQFAPHMTEGQLHDVVRQAHMEGQVHTDPYTQAPATISASEKPFYMDKEIKNFLDPGPKARRSGADHGVEVGTGTGEGPRLTRQFHEDLKAISDSNNHPEDVRLAHETAAALSTAADRMTKPELLATLHEFHQGALSDIYEKWSVPKLRAQLKEQPSKLIGTIGRGTQASEFSTSKKPSNPRAVTGGRGSFLRAHA